MEDNDKRKRTSEPDMFDAHEQTLPRFTIDPSDGPRQRTRTLLGVPSSIASEDSQPPLSPPEPPPFETAKPEPAAASGIASAILSTEPQPEEPKTEELKTAELKRAEPATDDVTVDVEDDLNNEITMVSDADVVALPDNTGQLQPVRFDEHEPAAASSKVAAAAVGSTLSDEALSNTRPAPKRPESVYPVPSSLAPREVARKAPAATPSNDSGNRLGALLVAAVVLLATGAWFLTGGTFRRATLTEVPNQTATAAATQPVNNMAAEPTKPEQQAPAPSEAVPTGADTNAQAANSAAPAPVATPQTDGPALKNKPSLTATARGERTRSSKKAGKAAPAPTGDLPEGPVRGEVITRLESVRPAVHACAAGRSGVADLDITIAHTGNVMHVLVGGDFAGTTEGSCIARAVRQARFPQFKQERFRVLYPYAI